MPISDLLNIGSDDLLILPKNGWPNLNFGDGNLFKIMCLHSLHPVLGINTQKNKE